MWERGGDGERNVKKREGKKKRWRVRTRGKERKREMDIIDRNEKQRQGEIVNLV